MILKHSLAQHNFTSHRLLVSAHQPGHQQNYVTSRALQKTIQKPYMFTLDRELIPTKKSHKTHIKI